MTDCRPRPGARPRRWASLLLLAGVALPAPGPAEVPVQQRNAICDDYEEITRVLTRQHGEVRLWWGVGRDGEAVVELHQAPATGAWTLLRVDPAGIACVVAYGVSGVMESRP